MRELSTEEKAQRYDEAIERARLVLQERGNEPDGASILSELFPELIESEDERIRKSLLAQYKGFKSTDSYDEDITFGDVVTWLEKQGEHANFRNKIQIGDKVTRNEDGVLVNLSQLNRVAKKQGEQKNTWSVEDENLFRCAIDAVREESKVRTDGCLDEEVGETVIDWLKSLKDRYTWKPTKEQIVALRWVLNNVPYCTYKEEISRLIDQIKDL